MSLQLQVISNITLIGFKANKNEFYNLVGHKNNTTLYTIQLYNYTTLSSQITRIYNEKLLHLFTMHLLNMNDTEGHLNFTCQKLKIIMM